MLLKCGHPALHNIRVMSQYHLMGAHTAVFSCGWISSTEFCTKLHFGLHIKPFANVDNFISIKSLPESQLAAAFYSGL